MKKNIKKIQPKLGSKTPLVKNLLLIEGLTRAGKFLLADVVAGLDGIEPVQYRGILEHIPFLEKFGYIDRTVAKEMLRCEIDSLAYETLIGRNINHRRGDKSSIYKNLLFEKFIARGEGPDGDVVIQKYQKSGDYSLFIMHEVMPNIGIYFEAFPELKVLNLLRSPVSLVSSWYKRGLGKRFGTDPKLFSLPVLLGGKLAPWFVADVGTKYNKLSEIDRVIISVTNLLEMADKGYNKLSPKNKKKILKVYFDDLVSNPKEVVSNISKFIGKKELTNLSDILKREKLPMKDVVKSEEGKIKEIELIASPEYFQRLMRFKKKYEES